MSRINPVFKNKNRKALIAYITAGYPQAESTVKAAHVLTASGCDIIEIGIPFSDPLADGVTIQNASHRALINGINTTSCMEIAGEIRKHCDVPLIFMTYLNPILSYGVERFCRDCSATGIDGLIVPDLPPAELPVLESCAEEYAIDTIYLIAPNSSRDRIRQIVRHSHGFIYIVSVTGVTGIRDSLPTNLNNVIAEVRLTTDLPLCIGFGISNPDQAARASALADGVVIGSRIIQIMEKDDHEYSRLTEFVRQVRASIDTAGYHPK